MHLRPNPTVTGQTEAVNGGVVWPWRRWLPVAPARGPDACRSIACGRLLRLWRERRANVAVLAAIMMPAFLGATGLGVEASNWSVLQTELQRTADAAALAAALAFEASGNASTATNAGADVAELNGVAGASTRTWNTSTKTLTDALITSRLVSGIKNASDNAFQVSVQQTVPLTFAKLFVTALSYNIAATATIELIPTGTGQPCVLGLNGYKTSITTAIDVTLSGSTSIVGTNCSVRSNGEVTLVGSSDITAASVYAGGTITTKGSAAVHAPEHPDDGQISDPYATYTPLQNAIGSMGACPSCVSVNETGSGSMTISPGTYSSMSIAGSSTLNMQPGLYVFNGNVSFEGSSTINASGGVTIVMSGTLTVGGSVTATITAPGTTPLHNGISGVAIAGTSTTASSVEGSSGFLVTGVVYFPNSDLTFAGSTGNQNSPCLEVIADTVTLVGSSNLGGNCSSYGAQSFGNTNAATTALVQ
jgi:hypothetical protein